MAVCQVNINIFLTSFVDVLNMMKDVGLLSSHIFSYSTSQDISNVVVQETDLRILVKFLDDTKEILDSLSTQSKSKDGYEEMSMHFEDRRDRLNVTGVCTAEVKAHGSHFNNECDSTTYDQMKSSRRALPYTTPNHQQRYVEMNEAASCPLSSLTDSRFNAPDNASQSASYTGTGDVNRPCYNMTGSSVSHNAVPSYNLSNHMVVGSHFQSNCETGFSSSSTNSLMQFPSCSREHTVKPYSSSSETQNHENNYLSHNKSQDFSAKPSCEFASQPTETGESHFTSPRGHFSPINESNCDTLYASRCETTQEAHFSCDTSFDTSNHSGHRMHTTTFPVNNEATVPSHYGQSNLPAGSSFSAQDKSQHSSAFPVGNDVTGSQYTVCHRSTEESQFPSSENARSYNQGEDIAQINSSNNFTSANNESCSAQGVTESRYPATVSNFKWGVGVLSDAEDSFGPSSSVDPSISNASDENTAFDDLQIALSNQLDSSADVNTEQGTADPKESSAHNFAALRLMNETTNDNGMDSGRLRILDNAKQESGKWKCPVCEKLFVTRSSLERHYRSQYLGGKAFPCSYCDKGFASKIRLDDHLMRQHNLNRESANPCPVCGKLFNTRSALKTHSLTHADDGDKPFACHICNKRFAQKVVLEVHIVRHGGPDTFKFRCNVCSKSFPTGPKLKYHMRKHEAAQYSCDQCSKQFTSEPLLRAHQATHTEASQRPFCCSLCSKAFNTKYKLEQHFETHARTNQYSCSQCSAQFRCRATWLAHLRRRHTLKEPEHYPCPVPDCTDMNGSFKNTDQLGQHLTPQGLEASGKFSCSICMKTFARKRNLRSHEKSCHPDQTDAEDVAHFSCELCPKKFKSKAKLKVHLSAHTEEPPLSCSTCGRRFYRTDLLKTHEASHTGNKPFTCEVCARRFATRSMLRSHQITHQPQPEITPEVPCPSCGKRFKNKRTLALHVKSHADSLEFTCGTCGKQFARRVHYDGHMRTHSADRPYSCTVCNRTFRERKHRADHMRRLHPNEVLGGGELTLQGLIDSITADDTLDSSNPGGSFEADNSDALASLTELSNAGMQQLLGTSTQAHESHVDESSESQVLQISQRYDSQPQNHTLESQVDNPDQGSQVNPLNHTYSSHSQNITVNPQADIGSVNQVNHLPENYSSQPQSLTILQNVCSQLKSQEDESGLSTGIQNITPSNFGCSANDGLNSLSELSDLVTTPHSNVFDGIIPS